MAFYVLSHGTYHAKFHGLHLDPRVHFIHKDFSNKKYVIKLFIISRFVQYLFIENEVQKRRCEKFLNWYGVPINFDR